MISTIITPTTKEMGVGLALSHNLALVSLSLLSHSIYVYLFSHTLFSHNSSLTQNPLSRLCLLSVCVSSLTITSLSLSLSLCARSPLSHLSLGARGHSDDGVGVKAKAPKKVKDSDSDDNDEDNVPGGAVAVTKYESGIAGESVLDKDNGEIKPKSRPRVGSELRRRTASSVTALDPPK